MATNVVYEKRSAVRVELTVGASKSSGDIEFLNDMPVFLLEDSDSSNLATVEIIGCGLVVDLSVVGADGAGNVAVAVGDKIFKDGSAYNKDSINGQFIGYALETVTSGSTTTIQVALIAGIAEAAAFVNAPLQATMVVGTEATNVINVAGQLQDVFGDDLAKAAAVQFYLADDAAGMTPSTTAPTGGIAIGTDGALLESIDNLSGTIIAEADGDFDIDLTDTGTPTFYLVLIMPNGKLVISDAITFA